MSDDFILLASESVINVTLPDVDSLPVGWHSEIEIENGRGFRLTAMKRGKAFPLTTWKGQVGAVVGNSGGVKLGATWDGKELLLFFAGNETVTLITETWND